MALPVTIPNTFANATTSIPLSQLDTNFSTLANAVNGINSGSEILANLKSSNVTITGGVISNVTLDNVTVDVETLSNVTINGGNVTVTNMVATTANATTGNITTVIVGAGTSAAPSITFTGDTNTGIFSPAADTIAFTEGGVEAMRIDASGNLGIGTSSPTQKLQVAGRIAVSGTNPSIQQIVQNSSLDLCGGTTVGTDPSIQIAGSTTTSDANKIFYNSNTHVFRSSSGGTTYSTIDSSGNLGIGTSSPIRPLQVGAYGTGNGEIALASSTTGFGSILFGDGGTGTDIFRGYVQYNHTSDAMIFATAAIERARIDSSGNLLVGTTTAAARFTIGGTAASAASSTICRIGDADYTTDTVLSVSPGVVNFDGPGVVGGRFHISSGGEVRIAGTTDQGAYNLQVQGTGVWGAGAYVNGSDSRIKEDIAPIATGLSVVEKLNPVTYRYKEDWSKDQSTQTGFIAQELLVALQDTNYVDSVVQQGGEKGYYSVAYQNIIPILTKAIQEQQALITQLQADVAALKGTA